MSVSVARGRAVHRVLSVVSVSSMTLLALVVPFAASATPAPAPGGGAAEGTVAGRVVDTSWFRDPLTHAERAAEIRVPRHPVLRDGSALQFTRAYLRTHGGRLAVPARMAVGHTLVEGQALTFTGDGLFKLHKVALGAPARRLVARLATSLSLATSVRCEGYADFITHRRLTSTKTSRARSKALCKAIAAVRPGLVTHVKSYGNVRPVVVGGHTRQRDANRRVVLVATGSITPVTVAPGAVGLPSVTFGDSSALVTFAAPTTGGAPSSYQVSTDGGTTWVTVPVTGASPYTVTIPGLVNGSSYDVVVRAVNDAGPGTPTIPMSGTPTAIPGAVPDFSVVPQDGGAALSFGAADDGGLPVTYQASTDGGTTWVNVPVSGPGPYTATLTGLTNGTVYPVKMRAINSDGDGPASAASNITPHTTAGAPTLSSVTSTAGGAVATFSAPSSNGGLPIVSFQVSTDDGSTWTTALTNGTGPFTTTLLGLTNGTSYAVRVRAVTGAGPGAESSATSVTPATTPGAPTVSAVTVGDGALTVSFATPSSNGGATITGYQVSTDNGSTWSDVSTSGSSPYSVTVTGLTNGTAYPVRVRAVNSAGNGTASAATTRTPADVPGAPTITSVTPSDGALSVVFTAPVSDGGDPVTGYEITTDGGSTWSTATTSGSGPFTTSVTGLTNGTTYQVKVRALNGQGHGPSSGTQSVTPATVPGAPAVTHVSVGDGTATLTFTAPSDNGGSAVTSYEVSTDNGTTWAPATTSGSGPYTVTVTGLTNGDNYPTVVRAVNGIGAGEASPPADVTPVAPEAPDVPTVDSVTPGDGAATIVFDAPSSDGGSAITGYQVSVDGGTVWTTVTTTGTGPLTATVTGLTNGTTYPVTVRAVNGVGHSDASASNDVTPVAAAEVNPPGIVPGTQCVNPGIPPAEWEIDVTFTEGDDTGITGYEYTLDGGSTWSYLGSSTGEYFAPTYTMANLSVTFDFGVRATDGTNYSTPDYVSVSCDD